MANKASCLNPGLSPEERYRVQLQLLSALGFFNWEANLLALTLTFGDLYAAVKLLLENMNMAPED